MCIEQRKGRDDMKLLLKILLSPILGAMKLITIIGSIMIYISGMALGIISGIVAVIGVVYIVTGSVLNGIIGLVIAYLLSPYGIPMFAIMILGVIQRLRGSLHNLIYG